MTFPRRLFAALFIMMGAGSCLIGHQLLACTGITLKAKDGAVVFGRTMEWGPFDLKSRLIVVPRGYKFSAVTPDGKPGISWTAKYGVAGLDGVGKDIVIDGMNEKGLQVGLFYHPGFAEYQKYDPARAGESMAPTDVGTYLLTTCESVSEARKAIQGVRVVPVVEEALGIVAGVHFIVTEPSGKAIVIEYLKGELTIFDAPLGTITNSPSYDWHETNLRNYVNLSPVAIPDKKIADLDFKPLGGGSGMIGLPGDFTPPSRFIRAVAFSQTSRPVNTGDEAMYEVFRILDNFNIPLGAAEGSGHDKTQGMRSATQWTTCSDTKNRVLYYHTQHNRRVRKVDLSKIDFATPRELVRSPLDKEKAQDIEDVTPRK
jgi:choloylglycine hydrolase